MTFGRLWGWDKYGDSIRIPCTCPERYKHTTFKYTRRMDTKREELVSVNLGPSGVETKYTLPFNKENVERLYGLRDEGFNSTSGFLVIDQASGGEKVVQVKAMSGDLEDTLKLFVDSEFSYLLNGDYVPLRVKAEARQAAIAKGLIPNSPLVVNESGHEISLDEPKPAPNTGTYS